MFFFFFSSRRRHTRLVSDWSSDVCSSDLEITIACGMTETSPVCNMTVVDDPVEVRVSTVGKVMPHQEQKIIDPDTGRIVPLGEPGELCYRGYQVMRGYDNNPEGTEQIIDRAGWL